MTDLVAALTTAFFAGLLGSAHCLGMCAGISGLFALHAGAAQVRSQLPFALTYNAGRLLSYTILGFLVAAAGARFVDLVPMLAGPVRLAAGLIIVLIGLQIAFDLRPLSGIERIGGSVWERVAPVTKRFLPVTNLRRALGLGLAWGLLPCGLVYSVLLIAAASAESSQGALVMLAFGIGTTPAMLMTGLGAARVSAALQKRRTRLGAGLLIVAVGVLTIAMPMFGALTLGGAHQH